IQLNMPYIREQLLPELTQRHFTHADGDPYRVAVISTENPPNVLFRSDPNAPVDPSHADATSALLGRADPAFFFGRPPRPPDAEDQLVTARRRASAAPAGAGPPRSPDEAQGRWLLLVQHQSGSLEAAVTVARRRNLAASFGILLLLTVSVGLLAATSRRA